MKYTNESDLMLGLSSEEIKKRYEEILGACESWKSIPGILETQYLEQNLLSFLCSYAVRAGKAIYEISGAHPVHNRKLLATLKNENFIPIKICYSSDEEVSEGIPSVIIYLNELSFVFVEVYDKEKIGMGKHVEFLFRIQTLDPEILAKFRTLFKTKQKKSGTKLRVFSKNDIITLSKIDDPIELTNYSDDNQDAFTLCTEVLTGEKKELGRLMILEGPPGTGKTYLIRGLITALQKLHFILIPPEMIVGISQPEILSMLLGYRRNKEENCTLVFVLEDADRALAERKADNMGAIHALLNLTDGLIGQALDLYVIASTNSPVSEIDAALKRPGRLAKYMHFGELPSEQCKEIQERLGAEPSINKPTTLAEVYKSSHNPEHKLGTKDEKKRRKVGF